jgi:hypothetical protein
MKAMLEARIVAARIQGPEDGWQGEAWPGDWAEGASHGVLMKVINGFSDHAGVLCAT